MGDDRRYCNKEIRGPIGALKVLRHLDFERIQGSGLQTKVVLYLGKGGVELGHTARYEGTVSTSPQLVLPVPRYFMSHLPNNELDSRVPASSLFKSPSRLEFVLSARTKPEYEGLLAFRDDVVPELIKSGYTRPSTEHTSHFWFYAGKNDVKTHLLCINLYDGLQVTQQEVDGVKLFTQKDVAGLMSLSLRDSA